VKRAAVLLFVIAIAFALLPACRREERRFQEPSMNGASTIDEAKAAGAAGTASKAGTATGPYYRNAWAMSEGARLYNQMNCVGCHAQGGGGMGPPLMDGKWLYGEREGDIFETIAHGRDDGMPAYAGRLTDQQIWQLVAYVRSLSGLAPMDASPSRNDHMAVRPPPNRMKQQPIEKQEEF
jgi:cytochrome c oxidase cbb3-type subunit III